MAYHVIIEDKEIYIRDHDNICDANESAAEAKKAYPSRFVWVCSDERWPEGPEFAMQYGPRGTI